MDPQEAFDLTGDALNRAVAVHVMGLREGVDFGTWPEHDWDDHGDCARLWCFVHIASDEARLPCVSKATAYSKHSYEQVIARLHARGWSVELRRHAPGKGAPQCMVYIDLPGDELSPDGYVGGVLMGGETIAEAVCRAALRAVLEYSEQQP
jgi:hypothetical protein